MSHKSIAKVMHHKVTKILFRWTSPKLICVTPSQWFSHKTAAFYTAQLHHFSQPSTLTKRLKLHACPPTHFKLLWTAISKNDVSIHASPNNFFPLPSSPFLKVHSHGCDTLSLPLVWGQGGHKVTMFGGCREGGEGKSQLIRDQS